MVEYLAIDPGNSTGWATFDEKGNAVMYGTCRSRKDVYEMLVKEAASVIIVEDYKLYPWLSKEQSWSEFETVRVIGAIECWAHFNGAKVHLQEPNIKAIGYRWAGLTKPKNHDLSHETDAFVHGVYYLQKAGIRTAQQGRAK